MTLAFPGARLPTAFAVSLAIHAVLAAALAAASGWQPGSGLPAIKPDGLLATLRTVQPSQPPAKPAAAPAAKPAPSRTASAPRDAASAGAALPKPYYYRASELAERPLPLHAIEPNVPADAAALSGRLKLRVYINEHGAVDAVDVVEADPAGEFEETVARAFSEARFRPGYKDGAAVKSQLALEVRFGEPAPFAAGMSEQVAQALPANPNAYDAPDRIGIKTRRPR
jgi:TonB family protein